MQSQDVNLLDRFHPGGSSSLGFSSSQGSSSFDFAGHGMWSLRTVEKLAEPKSQVAGMEASLLQESPILEESSGLPCSSLEFIRYVCHWAGVLTWSPVQLGG